MFTERILYTSDFPRHGDIAVNKIDHTYCVTLGKVLNILVTKFLVPNPPSECSFERLQLGLCKPFLLCHRSC